MAKKDKTNSGLGLNPDGAIAKLMDKNISMMDTLGDMLVADNTAIGDVINSYYDAKKVYKEGKNVKRALNSKTVGDPKKNDKWNDPDYTYWETLKGSIPILGQMLTVKNSAAVLQHNMGQIADDLYRQQLNPLMQDEVELEKRTMAQQGDYASKKLKTMEMRRDFWKKELESFKMNKTNKYYEEDVNKLQQLELDIELFKQQQGEFSASRAPKPEELFYDKLQNIRDSFLLSDKSQGSFDQYKSQIVAATANITKGQAEFFHVKTQFYEFMDKDLFDMERDQSAPRTELSRLISDYNKGAGSITKENFIHKLQGIIDKGKTSSDPEVQDTADAAERQIYFIEQTEKTKAEKKANAAKVIADREARERYNALKAQTDFEIKGVELQTESLQKHLRINDLKYKAEKDNINFRIKDEKIKQEILLELEAQRLQAAANLEFEYSQKHNVIYAGITEGFSAMWDNFAVGTRKAKNDLDKFWLGFRNPAMKRLGQEIGGSITDSDFFRSLFSSGSKATGGKKEGGGFWGDMFNYAMMALPFLAEGGIVNRPTIAMIGEAGSEAVIPLDQLNSQRIVYVQPIINGNFDVSMHKLNLKLEQNKQMMEALY